MNGLRKDLRAISGDGAATSVMVGIGETYFPAFVLALTHSQLASGLTATVPLVLGALLQLVTPRAVAVLGSYRRWVLLCVVVQTLSFVPLALAGVWGSMPVALAFAVIAVYWATGLGSGSAWNAWVGSLVPERIHNRYFAGRTGLTQVGLLVGLVLGGVTLQAGIHFGRPLEAFTLIFCGAILSRLVSARFLSQQREPLTPVVDAPPMRLREAIQALDSHATGRMLLYLFAVQAAVQISGPYFTPYMLRQLDLSYASYVILISAAYIAKIVSLPWMGRIADRVGAYRLLWIGGVAIIPMSSLWNISDNFTYLCLVQVVSGVAWGAYDLAMLLLFFRAIPLERRVHVLTLYNLANSTAILAGSLLGGLLLSQLGSVREAYMLLFLLSSTARIAALWFLVRVHRPAAESDAPVAYPSIERLPQLTHREAA